MKKLVLIDGNAILHRAYHALPPLTSRSGQPVNAVYGFWTMLFRIISDLKPTHLAVAFDTEKPTFRHTAYVGYQAHRPRLESNLAEQISIVQDVIKSAGIPIFIAPGYEADDVIGTLVAQVVAGPAPAKRGHTLDVIIVSGDRDLLQLISKNVKVYAPIKGLTEARLFDERGVEEYMGVGPDKIVDYKALVGDQSDNYPGVLGIGPKTAIQLIKKHGSVEGLYKALQKKDPALAANQTLIGKLTEGYNSAMLSKQLARIVTDAPVSLNFSKLEFKGFGHNPSLVEKFRELGFKSLVARIEPENSGKKQMEEEKNRKKKTDKKGDQLRLV